MAHPYAAIWGQRIKILRQANGLSQTDLADLCNVKQQTVNAWESGRAAPRDAMKPIVARHLGVQLTVLFAFPANGGEEAAS